MLKRELGNDCLITLNESPSEKEGKSRARSGDPTDRTLNESPSEKEGKSRSSPCRYAKYSSLNESPSEKEGKWA